MSEDNTQKLPNEPSFEARVFARFDAIDAQYRTLAEEVRQLGPRLERLEERALDTKPIWERALAELLDLKMELSEVKADVSELKAEVRDVKTELRNVNRKLDVLAKDIVQLRADQVDLDSRVEKLESKPIQ
jgi:chromosome segregation ATPase